MTDDGKAGSNTMDTYERYLCWVWYKMDDNSEYRLLNLELVQEGYSRSKNADVINFREELIAAADQARKAGIRIWGETDPDYCYTEAKELTLKAIVEDINANGTSSQYYLQKVIFTAQVVRISQQSTYYLNYTDPETGEVYGIQAYHRDSQTGYMQVGVTVRLSGTLTYYETGQVFQITDIVDRLLTSKVDNIKVVEEYKEPVPTVITGEDANGKVVTIRTDVLIDKTGQFIVDKDYKVLQSNFEGKYITVLGVIEMYEGAYQVKVVSPYDIAIN